MSLLDPEDQATLLPAETAAFASPIPTQFVSSDYEKLVRAGLVNVCVHKGPYPQSTTRRFPNLVPYADVRDVGKAARDWPQLNFVISRA